MLKRFTGRSFCAACALAVLTSCGGGDLGSGIGEFKTVSASASADTLRLESDVATGNSCDEFDVSTGGTLESDVVDVTFTSRPLTTPALSLAINKITVKYTGRGTATIPVPPVLPDYVQPTTGFTIAPGASVDIPVHVLPEDYKLRLLDPALANGLGLCGMGIAEYVVTITFEVTEPGGEDDTRAVTTTLIVAVADRAE